MSLHLTEDELYDVTGYRHKGKVALALAVMGVSFKIRPADGFVLVLREHYASLMSPTGSQKPRRGPNWGALDGKAADPKQALAEICDRATRVVLVRPDRDESRAGSEGR